MKVSVSAARTKRHRDRLFIAATLLSLSLIMNDACAAGNAPPQTHDAIDVPTKPSSIIVPVTISMADLQAQANAQIPTTLYSIDQNQDGCVPAQWINVCVLPRPWPLHGCAQYLKTKGTPAIDCHLQGSVTRRNVTVGGSGANLTLSVPIDISVTASGRGDIGKNIHQTGSANMVANVTVSFDVDENWQPAANVNANYNWTDPPHVWILGFKITFADKVDPKIRDFIAQLQQKLPSLLANLKLRDIAQKYWDAGFTTLSLNDAPPVWLSIVPETVGYGGYQIASGNINLTFMAGGKVATGGGLKPSDPTPTPLPILQRSLPAAGFDFSVPITADYATLHDQLAAALKFGKEQTLNLQGYGDVKVTVNNVTLYQTDGRSLAIGVDLDASPTGNFAAAKGVVWVTTKIKIDNTNHTVLPDEFKIYGKDGNGPLDLLVLLVQLPPLKGILSEALKYNFTPQYDKLVASANAALRRQITPALYIDGKISNMAPESVNAGPDGLMAIVGAHGVVAVHSGTMP